MDEESGEPLLSPIERAPSSSQVLPTLSLFERYKTQITLAPRTHRAFLCIVCLHCMYIVMERIYVLTTDFYAGDRAAIWFFIVIDMSMCFMLYFAFHSVVHVNVSAFCS
jgi:hypothetical protein